MTAVQFVKIIKRNVHVKKSSCILLTVIFLFTLLLQQTTFQKKEKRLESSLHYRFPIARNQSYRHLNITVIAVVGNMSAAENDYRTALSTVRCYCKMHNYQFKLVDDSEYRTICRQEDFMFRRHCIVAELLLETEWLVFLDADMAVVNPSVLLEDYINPLFDITFYNRFVNWEVAAGSYIVRNTPWAINFLREFADFESQLPQSFHGTDNGALHAFLQQKFYPQLAEESQVCMEIWKRSARWDDLFAYEACIRAVMGDVHEFEKARILKKGRGWVRDIWLSDSQWSPERDFMLHGLKEVNRIDSENSEGIEDSRFNWKSPFCSPPRVHDCVSPKSWKYNNDLIVSSRMIEKELTKQFIEVEQRKWKSLARVADYLGKEVAV